MKTKANVYDEAVERVRRAHYPRAYDAGGWSCSCGAGNEATGPNATRRTAYAATQRHLDAAYKRVLAALLEESREAGVGTASRSLTG